MTPDRAFIEIEKDIAVIKSTHAFMTQQTKVIGLIYNYLRTGSFK